MNLLYFYAYAGISVFIFIIIIINPFERADIPQLSWGSMGTVHKNNFSSSSNPNQVATRVNPPRVHIS
jgi:hypothetical protein